MHEFSVKNGGIFLLRVVEFEKMSAY